MGETQPGALNLAINCQPTGGFKSHEARGDHQGNEADTEENRSNVYPLGILLF